MKTFKRKNLEIYFKSSEDMSEIPDKSIDLFISGSVHLGNEWKPFHQLFNKVYLKNLPRVIKDDGYILIMQTDGYKNNEVFLKSLGVLNMMLPNFRLIDTKIWKRYNVNFYQVPYSHFYLFTTLNSKVGRRSIKSKEFLRGVWDYKPTKGSEFNAWSDDLCTMMLEALTRKGDVVVDPFAGTSRMLINGAMMDRICYGYEIDESRNEIITDNYNELESKYNEKNYDVNDWI